MSFVPAAMRVLAHIHTFNDADIIDRAIAAILGQTRRVDEILVVDNGSSDDTLDQPSLRHATVLRHPENLGTSGSVRSGFTYALERGFDWIWIFDADSLPEPDALEQLLDLYASSPPDCREEIGCLACLPINQVDGQPLHASVLTRLGRVFVEPEPGRRHYPFDVTIWSGCLYRLAAVRKVGLPNPDYVLDFGENEYGHRLTTAGYKALVDQRAVMKHNIRGDQSLQPLALKLGPLKLTFYENPPIRCYYLCRNTLYFTLYDYAERRFGVFSGALWRVRPAPGRPGLLRGMVWRLGLFTLNFLVRPRRHGAQIAACCRGIWHGLTGNISARY
jgi:GT2 family glycosyltransferase